jgi:glycosyltransferase involved in cell wall biosynthesis
LQLASIIVIAFNQEKTILETLDSLKTAGIDDVEILICDDSSTDCTRLIIDEWCQSSRSWNGPIKIIFHEKNLGICGNFASGCMAAKGKYVKLIGGDDKIVPGSLSRMINWMERENLIVAFGRPTYLMEDDSFEKRAYAAMVRNFTKFNEFSAKEQFRAQLKINRVFSPCAIMERKTLLNKLPAISSYTMLEDWPLWLSYSESGIRIRYLDIDFVQYRVHSSNMSRQSRRAARRSEYGKDIMRMLSANRRLMPSWRVRDVIELNVSHLRLKKQMSLENMLSLRVRSGLWKVLLKVLTYIDLLESTFRLLGSKRNA